MSDDYADRTALLDEVGDLWAQRDDLPATAAPRVRAMIDLVDSGVARSARIDAAGAVTVDERVKRAILLAFRLFPMAESRAGEFRYVDRLPLKHLAPGVRVVPGGIVRWGAYLAPGVTVMPSFTNIGAYVDADTMIDTWATVGSCAQIGARVHLSGGVGIGGVLEPVGATPVVVEDDAFVGSRALVVEGARVRRGAVLGAGAVLTATTRVYDVESGEELPAGEVPAWSVCVPGTRARSFPGGDFGVPCLLVLTRLAESERHDKTVLDEVFRAHADGASDGAQRRDGSEMTIEREDGGTAGDLTPLLERLILATARERDLLAALDGIGADRVADLLVDEVVFRAPLPTNVDRVVVGLDLTHRGATCSFEITVCAESGVVATRRPASTPHLVVGFELADLARSLFGPSHERLGRMHRTELRFVPSGFGPGVETDHEVIAGEIALGRQMSQVLGILDRAWSAPRENLDELAVRYGSDKFGIFHWFTPHYERHCGHLRDRPARILEIGIGGYADAAGYGAGGSLRVWKHYFSRSTVFGIDIVDKSELDGPRLVTLRCDQSDPHQLRDVAERHGPFDLVIDDGSHLNAHVRTAFQVLFPHVRAGGVYVIEDLWTSYAPDYGGNATDLDVRTTTMGLLKMLTDALHHEEHPRVPGRIPESVEQNVAGMHLYHNIAFIDKGPNAEGGIPGWLSTAPHW